MAIAICINNLPDAPPSAAGIDKRGVEIASSWVRNGTREPNCGAVSCKLEGVFWG